LRDEKKADECEKWSRNNRVIHDAQPSLKVDDYYSDWETKALSPGAAERA